MLLLLRVTLLVIDRSGNRAGALIGYHLAQLGFSLELIVRHNNWEELVADPGLNIGYLETGVGGFVLE